MIFERTIVALVALALSSGLMALPANALDLGEAQRAGAVVARALDLGESGDWGSAQRVAAQTGDPVIRDIVLWRKLRAGAGTMAEYRDFVSRRSGWPGQKILAQVVAGGSAGAKQGPRLAGAAAANWQRMSLLWRNKRYDEAGALLVQVSDSPHKLGVPALWGNRRALLARRAARSGAAEEGYLLASRHHLTPADGYDYADLEWLAGWIALRKLGRPAAALPHFERFNKAVETPISLGRGGYWLGRTYEALGDKANTARWYRAAAANQSSFYGQLAAEKLGAAGDRQIAAAHLPDWSKSPVLRSDDVHAGLLLTYAGEDRLSFLMFSHLGSSMEGGAALGALAGLGLKIGRPHYAVRVAKYAARKGILLYPAYYPVTELAGYASKVEPALAMAIARQETELNAHAVSPAGARGLMQLMPATAKKVAGWIGESYSSDRLLDDWRYNARLGQTYLAEQITTYGGSYVLAAAAYNAGPHRVDAWIGAYGDPRTPGTDMIDWIETIPFSETRNYVQRVMEALYVYRARLAGTAGPMTISHDLARGVRG